MKVLDVLGVRVEMPTNHPIVLLRERDGDRYLPIWIGAAEATAIAYAQQGDRAAAAADPRPDKNVIEGLGHRLTEVRIVELKDGVFHAALVLDGTAEISSRSSDAIALALRTGTEIVAGESLLEEAGVVDVARGGRTTRWRSSRSSSTRSRPRTSRQTGRNRSSGT